MDLTKIAENTEMTYLEKVAAIVDEFAAGNVSGEDADALAQEAGIAPADLLAVHTAAYGEDIEKVASENGAEDIEKVAADEATDALTKIAGDENATYLTKCAGIADAFAAGVITGEEGDELANEMGLAPADVAAVFDAAYSEDIEKTASEEAGDVLSKIASDENSSYLVKCAGIADAVAAEAITADEGIELAGDFGVEVGDVAEVMTSAYADELEKEAGDKVKAIKDFVSKAGGKVSDAAGSAKDATVSAFNKAKGAVKSGAEATSAKAKEVGGKAKDKASAAYTSAKEGAKKAGEKVGEGYKAAGGHKTAAGVAGGAAAGGSAGYMFGKKD